MTDETFESVLKAICEEHGLDHETMEEGAKFEFGSLLEMMEEVVLASCRTDMTDPDEVADKLAELADRYEREGDEDDAISMREITDLVRDEDWVAAYDTMVKLDTIVRDAIPEEAWVAVEREGNRV